MPRFSVVWLVPFLVAPSICPLAAQVDTSQSPPAQVETSQRSPSQVWLGGTGGVGTAGMAGRVGVVVSVRDWALTGRYAKTMSGGGRRTGTEAYSEDYGLLVGRVIRKGSGLGRVSLGAGPVRTWDYEPVPCSHCLFGNYTKVRSTTAESYGGLVEAAIYPGANGGAFVWGFDLFGAISPDQTYVSVGVTLGLGRAP